MQHQRNGYQLFLLGAIMLLGLGDAFADGLSAGDVTYATVALDSAGETYFDDMVVPYELKDFAPPAGPIGIAAKQPAASLVFTTLPGRWDGDWHPAPRRQFVFLLGGAIDIEVASGETRRFETGDIVFLEDTTGRGHDTRVAGDEPAVFAIVALP